MLRLLLGCCLLGLVWTWNQPSTCYIRQSTCSSDSQINNDIQRIRETMEDSLPAIAASLNSISASLQILVTTEPSTDPTTTDLPMESTTSLPTEPTTHTNPPTELTTPTNPPTESLTTCGNTTEGWRRVTFLDMTNPTHNCPNGLQLTNYSIRSCGRTHIGAQSCSSSTLIPIGGQQYSQVCGRAKAYHWGVMNAFFRYHQNGHTIDAGAYVTGLSFTHGTVRTHIWTFAAGSYQGVSGDTSYLIHRCPCDPGNTYSSPLFVGNDYFCDSGAHSSVDIAYQLYPDDPLWDGRGCIPGNTCCQHNNPPWFYKTLPTPTTDDIEMRMCLISRNTAADIAIEQLEIYVR